MEKRKKMVFLVIGILLCIGIVVGVSFALWNIRVTQKSSNQIKSGCLNLELLDETAAISLNEAFPLTDKEASNLEPYRFTIKNTCNTEVVYDVRLEIMEVEDRLENKYIAVSIDDEPKRLLDTLEEVTPIYDEKDYTPIEGRTLISSGTLAGMESKSYDLRLWLNDSITEEDDVMEKKFIKLAIFPII